jgi:Tol biopolymer transport system component
MTTPVPDDSSHTRTILIASVVAAAVLLVGVGVAFAVMASRAPKPPRANFTPAQETSATESSETSGTDEASETASSPTTSSSSPSTQAVAPVHPGTNTRASRIAYRMPPQAIWVTDEDGKSNTRLVFRSAGAFSLSPDGTTLAVIDTPSGGGPQLVLVDVASGMETRVPGPTELPEWSSDSSWLAYSVSSGLASSLRRVNRDGTGDALIVAPGDRPRISTDGRYVAYIKNRQDSPIGPLLVYDTQHRTTKTVPSADGSLDYAWGTDGSLYFAQAGTAGGKATLRVADKTRSQSSLLVSLATTSTLPFPGALLPSPDGAMIALTMSGDDNMARLVMVDIARKTATQVSTRRSAYPLTWGADGKTLLYIDGNADMEEKTSLYRMNPDASQRRILVTGAEGP